MRRRPLPRALGLLACLAGTAALPRAPHAQEAAPLAVPEVGVTGNAERALDPLRGFVARQQITGTKTDTPLLDLVADVRASTPTDAARVLVPDVAEELAGVVLTVERMRSSIGRLLDSERAALTEIRRRPVLADPHALLRSRDEEVAALLGRIRQTSRHHLRRAADDIEHHTARVRALSPLATLKRGYAVVQDSEGAAVRTASVMTAHAADAASSTTGSSMSSGRS